MSRKAGGATSALLEADSIEDVIPTSDVLHRRHIQHNASEATLECYYSSVKVRRGRHKDIIQCIQIGDLIPVRRPKVGVVANDHSSYTLTKREPFFDTEWAVAQILTLYSSLGSSTVASKQQQQQPQAFHAHVKWFIPCLSPMTALLLHDKEVKLLKKLFRPQFSLLEQQAITDIISINQDILPGCIVLKPPAEFKDKTPSNEIIPGCYEIPFFCKRRLEGCQKQPAECNNDDFQFTSSATVPASITRGWDSMGEKYPDLFSTSTDTGSTFRQVMMNLLQLLGSSRKTTNFSVFSSAVRHEKSGFHHDASNATIEGSEESTSTTDTTTTANSSRSNSAAATSVSSPSPNVVRKNKKMPQKIVPSRKNIPVKKVANKQKKHIQSKPIHKNTKKVKNGQLHKHQTTMNSKGKKRSIGEDCSIINTKKVKKSTTSDYDAMAVICTPKNNKHTNKEPLSSEPVGKVLYRYEVPRSERKDSTKQLPGRSLEFYKGVQIKTNWDGVSARGYGLNRDVKLWKINVGDLIAVACRDATTKQPIYTPNKSSDQLTKKDEWFPFNIPWSPAQVLAIYRKKSDSNDIDFTGKYPDEVWLQLRWLYRPNDLKDTVISKEQRQELLLSATDNSSKRSGSGTLRNSRLLSGRNFIEVDFGVDEAFASAALGRIITTGKGGSHYDVQCSWLTKFAGKDGIPQIPIICRYSCFIHQYNSNTVSAAANKKSKSLELLPESAWSNYVSSIQDGPLNRFLLCPLGYPGKSKKLREEYESFLRHRDRLKDKRLLQAQKLGPGNHLSVDEPLLSPTSLSEASVTVSSWPDDLLLWQDTKKSTQEDPTQHDTRNTSCSADVLHYKFISDDIQRVFMQSIPAQLVSRRYRNPRVTGKKSSDVTEWTIHIGDVVCVARNGLWKIENSQGTGIQSKKRSSWDPFVGPWKICQILSIYYDQSNETRDDESPTHYLEVRWFHRKSDMPLRILTWMPPSYDSTIFEHDFFETDCVEDGIPLSHVLGCVDLFLGHHAKASNIRREDAMAVPSVRCRCQYFYFSQFERFQPLFCSATDSKDWFRLLFERGLRLSSIINEDKSLAQVIENFFEVNLKEDSRVKDFHIVDQLIHDMNPTEPGKVEKEASLKQRIVLPDDELSSGFEYYHSTSVVPAWAYFANSEIVCAKRYREGLRWTVRVGDVVAVKTLDSSSQVVSIDHLPFKCSWRPAQVLALFCNQKDEVKNETCTQVQVRWLCRKSEHTHLRTEIGEPGLDSIYETDQIVSDPLAVNALLGPIALVPNDNLQWVHRVWQTLPPYLPVSFFLYGGSYSTNLGCRVAGSTFCDIVQRGLGHSDHYGVKGRLTVLDALKKDCVSVQKTGVCQLAMQLSMAESLDTSAWPEDILRKQPAKKKLCGRLIETWTSVSPFHFDQSTGCEYFHEVDVKPPYIEYVMGKPTYLKDQSPVWTVRLGDMIALTYDYCSDGITKAAYSIRSQDYPRGGNYWPFKTQWAVGEVVSIMKMREKLRSSADPLMQSDLGEENQLKFEIRWFYRPSDLPGMKKRFSPCADLNSEEILESDEYEEIDSSRLLSPVDLHENPVSVTDPKTRMGMPVIDFFCNRFYSIQHKSLIPAAGLDGRISRGHSKSRRIGNDAALKASLESVFATKPSFQPRPSQHITKMISKFTSWKDSFQQAIMKLSLTDASQEAFKDSSVLVGRAKERKHIITFLRSSIKGDTSDKPSIFVAGPPGVGKTASIRAAISELKHDQSAGTIPEFDFVSLNGMEMRHPFEAYVKLWKEMSRGTSNPVSAEKAASDLEAHFSGKKSVAESVQNRIVVVLLDEIDYLVTSKQTVLYNFFDWPMRSLEAKSRTRLIVIGVSNTLNLPERLHPRVQSRIGSKRIFFKSYNVDETVAILKAKVEQASPNYAVFDDDSILFAAKKTAALSGDIRKAFHICRTAADMVMNETLTNELETPSDPIVRIKDVLKVSRESSNTAHSRALALCTPYEALLIISLASLAKSTGREFGSFDLEEILIKMEAIANASGNSLYQPAPDFQETLGMLSRLREADLVSLETPRSSSVSYRSSLAGIGGAWPLVSMIIDDHAVLQALKKTAHHELARKYLVNSF